MLDPERFRTRLGIEPWTPLLEVADFNSLIALSQEFQVPVYALTARQTGQAGAVWDQTQESMAVFGEAFSDCAEKIFRITQ
jgi:predicted lactoylglutathione lyase